MNGLLLLIGGVFGLSCLGFLAWGLILLGVGIEEFRSWWKRPDRYSDAGPTLALAASFLAIGVSLGWQVPGVSWCVVVPCAIVILLIATLNTLMPAESQPDRR